MNQRVFWGHDLDDYMEMFDLAPADFKGSILEYGAGPSALNRDLLDVSARCVSCDPLFVLDYDTLKIKTALVFQNMIDQVIVEQTNFDFSKEGGVEGLIKQRREGMERFFLDYPKGKRQKRYFPVQTIDLPFKDFEFDYVLSSHYLFSGLDGQNETFHVALIQELARVAKEVRIFPLIDSFGNPSPFIGPVLLALQQKNYGTEIRSVAYHLQKKGNAMLRVWAQECRVA